MWENSGKKDTLPKTTLLDALIDEAQLIRETRPWLLTGQTVAEWVAPLVPERLTMLPCRWSGNPGLSGVYLLFAADGSLTYIGKASHIAKRLRQHWIDGRIPMVYMAWIACPPEAALVLEAYLIGEDDPPFNRKFDPPMMVWHEEVAEALSRLTP